MNFVPFIVLAQESLRPPAEIQLPEPLNREAQLAGAGKVEELQFKDEFGVYSMPARMYEALRALVRRSEEERPPKDDPFKIEPEERDFVGDFYASLGYPEAVRRLQAQFSKETENLAATDDAKQAIAIESRIAGLVKELDGNEIVQARTGAIVRMLSPTLFKAAKVESSNLVADASGGVDVGRINWEVLRSGDVLLRNSGGPLNFIYTMSFSHAGIYLGGDVVYEAIAGQRLKEHPLSEWKDCKLVAICRPESDAWQRAVTRSKESYELDKRPYNFNFMDPETEQRFYCSQLVWRTGQHIELEFDSNSNRYLTWLLAARGIGAYFVGRRAVAPDELFYSRNLKIVALGRP